MLMLRIVRALQPVRKRSRSQNFPATRELSRGESRYALSNAASRTSAGAFSQ
jgi:hypothetical protein